MSNLTLRGNASGSGTFIVESPNSNTSRTITLPDATTTLVGTDATQTLTNKTIQGGALTLDTVKASTSGTAIDFTGIPSWVKRVTVMFDGVSVSGTASIQVQLGTSGGVQTTGYNSNSTQLGSGAAVSVLTSTSGFVNNASSAASAYSGQYTLSLLDQANGVWVLHGAVGVNGTATIMINSGRKSLSGTLDRIRVTTTGTDTFDAGSINIIYEG